MSTENEHNSSSARDLGRWLDQPGTPAPDSLDADVIEAIFALKPEYAPAPRITADEILAGLTDGPLVANPTPATAPDPSSSGEGAEIVPFPGSDQEEEGAQPPTDDATEDRAQRSRRAFWWAGGAGGVGLALVTVATLLMVMLPRDPAPQLADAAAPQSETPVENPGPTTVAKRPLENQIAEERKAVTAKPSPASQSRRERSVARPTAIPSEAEAAAAPPAPSLPDGLAGLKEEAQDGNEVFSIHDQAFNLQDTVIAEVGDRGNEPAAGVMPAPQVAASRGIQPEPRDDSAADGLMPVVEQARRLAQAGERAQAAALLEANISGSGPEAHALALEAAQLYVGLREGAAAIRVLDLALTFGAGTSDQQREAASLRSVASELLDAPVQE